MRKHRKIKLVCLILALCAALLAAIYLPVHGEQKIYDTVLRLHVLANSDSEEDQALKLQVRDAILRVTTENLGECATREEAAARVTELMPILEQTAQEVVREAGYAYPVRLTLDEEVYPTRNYESFCFPSGEYLSLRVLIGDAAGKNWWCVLFPPLCLQASTVSKKETEEQFVSVGLSRDQYAIITETQDSRYRMRFKLLETLEAWYREMKR